MADESSNQTGDRPQLLHLFSAMDPGVVPEDDDVSAQVAQHMLKERGHFSASEDGFPEGGSKVPPVLSED